MNRQFAAATASLGALLVIFSQIVPAYTLEDPMGVDLANVALLAKHGPVTILFAVIAGLAASFLATSEVRMRAVSPRTAMAAGVFVSIMGLAVMLVFWIVDLPDVGSTGMFDTPGAGNLDATGVAAPGLWLELIGGVVLLLAGIALVLGGRQSADSPPAGSRRTGR